MTKRRRKLTHYLVTVSLAPHGNMHSYVMTDDTRRIVERVSDKMFSILEQQGIRPLPLILATVLNRDGVVMVRKIIGSESAEAKRAFTTATDFHCSIFSTSADNPNDARLMELH